MNLSFMVLGVTGVIGSGRSTACRILRDEFGFHWIETDRIVAGMYLPGGIGYKKIKEYFGAQFVGKNGVLRGRLRRAVLKNQQKLWILNKLMHPLIWHEVNKKIVQLKKEDSAARICVEALYFEPKDLGSYIDELVKIDASDRIIMMRLKARRVPQKQLAALLYFQRKLLPFAGFKMLKIENYASKAALKKNMIKYFHAKRI